MHRTVQCQADNRCRAASCARICAFNLKRETTILKAMIRGAGFLFATAVVAVAAGGFAPVRAGTADAHGPSAVHDRRANGASSMDPLAWLQQELTAGDGTSGDNFGYSVAVSGTLAVVGALQATVDGHQYQGAAYVFAESDGIWSEQQKLTSSDGGADDNFGKTVATDGTTVLVGAHGATVDGHRYQGAVYVFRESGGTWTQQQKLVASDGAGGDNFGGALALNGDTALVGAFNATVDGVSQQGAAYVFDAVDGVWTQAQKLTASDGAEADQFGHAVALDGVHALVAAWGAGIDGNYGQGAVYAFDDDGGNWSETQKLVAFDGAGSDTFGGALAVLGNSALIGAPYAQIGGNYGQGAVYAFANDGNGWNETQKLTASDGGMSDNYGYVVAIDGGTALVGAANATVNGSAAQGAAYLLADIAGSWSEQQKLIASDGTSFNKFGCAGDIAGGTVLVGAEFASVDGEFGQGIVYAFAQDSIFDDGFDGP
jgi:hypothetical protein